MILREATILLYLGMAVGIIIALLAVRAAAFLLFGLKPYDPITFLIAVGTLAVAGLAASYLPARRAASLDPMNALREE